MSRLFLDYSKWSLCSDVMVVRNLYAAISNKSRDEMCGVISLHLLPRCQQEVEDGGILVAKELLLELLVLLIHLPIPQGTINV